MPLWASWFENLCSDLWFNHTHPLNNIYLQLRKWWFIAFTTLFISLCVYPVLPVRIRPLSVCFILSVCLSVDGSSLSCTDHPGLHAGRLKWTSLWAGWGNRWTGMMGRSHCMCVQLGAEQQIRLIPEPIHRWENIQKSFAGPLTGMTFN